HARRQRHAEPDRQAVAQGAGAGLDARRDGLGMAAQNGVEAAEAVELLEREEAAVGEHGIEREAAMALAQDEAIALAPARFGRPIAQEVVVKDSDDFDERQRGPDMSTPALLDGAEDQAPQMAAALVEGFTLHRLQVGVVVRQRRVVHEGGYTLSVCPHSA